MKRIALTAVLTLALVFLALPISGGTVSAQTQKEADTCYDKWHGDKFFNDDKSKKRLNNYNNEDPACDEGDGGNCSTVSKGEGSFAYLQIKCGKKPGTFPGNTAENSDPGTVGQADTIQDPAISGDAKCTTDNCELITNYVNPFIVLMTVLVGIAITIGIIFGAIQVISSAGDPQKNASGKDHIRNALIALVGYIILFSFLQWIIPGGLGS